MPGKRIIKAICCLLIILSVISCGQESRNRIVVLATTDLHGTIFPYDYIEDKPLKASLANISTYITGVRKKNHVILLDNGDNLQGQPAVYYFNYIDTVSRHISSMVMNYLGYDAGTVGNHDIEAGHSVYDRLRREYNFPLLAANAVKTQNGEPYFEPYCILEKNGLKVAVFGLITPSVPEWLPPVLYSGMEFKDMVETAKKWMPLILKQKPDIVIGLFHSGTGINENQSGEFRKNYENSSGAVAYYVPGFDIVIAGHDHGEICTKVTNIKGDTVLIIDAGSRAEKIARVDIEFPESAGKRRFKISGSLIDVSNYNPDQGFIREFADKEKIIRGFVKEVIGESSSTFTSRDAFFGPSAFVDMIHTIQLEITGADISFAAPLSFDVRINKGPLTVGDMFKLYRYENMLYTIELKGYEIVKYLEYSYSGWFNTMKSSGDHLLNFRTDNKGNVLLSKGKAQLRYPSYNFDSAAGIEYVVDVSKPAGKRIKITGMKNGRSFYNNNTYLVAVNSYRGSGGGGHLTEGVSLDREELAKRLKYSTVRDLRYYIIEYLKDKKRIEPESLNSWKIIPEEWVKKAWKRDYKLLFGE